MEEIEGLDVSSQLTFKFEGFEGPLDVLLHLISENNMDINEIDEFNDKFRGKCINCQADVIRDYVKYGRDYIMQSYEVKEFLVILKP